MFGFKWPYTDFHRLNADWILRTMRELKERIEQALAGVTEYGDRLDAAETDIDGLESAVATNTHDIQSAGVRITGLEGRMDAAEADIDGVEHDVEGMRSTIAGLQLTTAQHTQQIGAQGEEIAAQGEEIAAQGAQITALEGRMDAAEADIGVQGERLDAVEELAASSPYIATLSYSNGAYALSASVADIVDVLAQGERPVIINAQGVGDYPGNPQPRISEVQISDLKTALIGNADTVEGTVTLTIGTAQELKMTVTAGAQEPDVVGVTFQTVPIGGGVEPVTVTVDTTNNTWSGATWAALLNAYNHGCAFVLADNVKMTCASSVSSGNLSVLTTAPGINNLPSAVEIKTYAIFSNGQVIVQTYNVSKAD